MKTKFTLTLLPLFFLILFYPSSAFTQTINITNYGATVNNSSNDDTPGIREAIEACRGLSNPVLYFPTGTYHLDSEAGIGNYFFINGINNLTIDGAGSTIMITGGAHRRTNPRNTFKFWNCNNLNIKNLNTDFENPPFSQTRVIASGPGYLNLQLQSGFSMTQDNGTNKDIRNYTAYDPILGQQVNEQHSWNNGITWSWANKNQNIIRINDNQFNYPAGTHVYLRHSQYDGYTYFMGEGCKNVVLENINVYKASGYPFYANEGAENLSFINCGIRKSAPSFWATATADGAHLLDARGDILFDGCHFEGQNDDGINLHSYFVNIIQSINQKTIRVDNTEDFHYLKGWRVGDTVEFFIKSNVQSIGTRVITNISNVNNNSSQMTLEFNDNLPDFTGGISAVKISNISCIGNLTVKNTTFKGNRSRGILVSTDNVLIENCTFNRTMTEAILMEISTSWNESIPARNLIIRNNVFDEVVYGRTSKNSGAITFSIIGFTMGSECDIFKNVSITGNTFRKINSSAIYARRIAGLEIGNNIIENPGTNGRLIRYGNSKNITIGNNPRAIIDNMRSNCPDDTLISVTGITITPKTISLAPTQTVQLTTTVTPENATNKSLTWSSSDISIASVNSNGLVSANTVGGPVTITAQATDGGYVAAATITVIENSTQTNIAHNKPVTVSAFTDPATNLVDEDEVTRWSANIFPQNAVIDLGAVYDISSFEVYPYMNIDYKYIIEIKHSLSDSYTTAVDRSNNSISAAVITDAVSVSGRYLRITVMGAKTYTGTWTSLNEFKAYGSLAGAMSNSATYKQLFSVFPNPADDFIQVSIPNAASLSSIQFKLYDMLGKLVYQEKVDSSQDKWQIDLNNLSKGIHILEITTDNQLTYHKIVKK